MYRTGFGIIRHDRYRRFTRCLYLLREVIGMHAIWFSGVILSDGLILYFVHKDQVAELWSALIATNPGVFAGGANNHKW
jgi:hypothetical protein